MSACECNIVTVCQLSAWAAVCHSAHRDRKWTGEGVKSGKPSEQYRRALSADAARKGGAVKVNILGMVGMLGNR